MVRADGTSVSVGTPVPYPILADESAEPDMVNSQPEDHGESSSLKKRAQRKKPVITGIWPCKINGCNKQFAREADLKRHQRTTKLHSMPSFACPQCDANFTRTDALRRHQKSRHHGVVIEPIEVSKDDDDSRSRSGTPSSLKGKEKATNLPVPTYQGAPTNSGPSSYYRSHTATTTPYIPPRPTQLGLPTSSVRAGPPWPEYPPSWQNGPLPPNVGAIGYTMSMYYPSPHYRPHTNGYHTGHSPPPQPPPPPLYHSAGASTTANTSRNPSSQPPNSSSSISESSITCIDPELEGGSELTAADVVAAVQAVLLQAETEEKAKRQREKEEKERLLRERGQEGDGTGGLEDDEPMDIDRSLDDGMSGLHGYGSLSLRRPEPMEHILTEDGEPMLNPAELLTQESLAESPPP